MLIGVRAGRFLSPIPEITRSPMEFDQFDQACSVPPPQAVQDPQPLRHALRGAAEHFGALEVAALCEQLERLARTGGPGGAIELIETLEEAFARAREALTRSLSANAG